MLGWTVRTGLIFIPLKSLLFVILSQIANFLPIVHSVPNLNAIYLECWYETVCLFEFYRAWFGLDSKEQEAWQAQRSHQRSRGNCKYLTFHFNMQCILYWIMKGFINKFCFWKEYILKSVRCMKLLPAIIVSVDRETIGIWCQ